MLAEPRTTLSARISAGAGGLFAVEIDDDAAMLREEECFRFALQYYARVLFELVHSQRSVRDLPKMMSALAQNALEDDDDLFALAGIPGQLVRTLRSPIAVAEVTMRISGVRNREVTGDLSPLRGTTM